MRTVHVDDADSGHTWIWITAGAALGLVAGVLLADRIKGRRRSLTALLGKGRRLATTAIGVLGPLLQSDDEELDDEELDAEETDEAEDEADSDALDARVLEAFINDPILAERSVEIEERDNGVIVLHGQLRSEKETKHAVTIARGVPGVERVRTRLTVRERPR